MLDYRQVEYCQEHNDGRTTSVTIDGRGGDWSTSAIDVLGEEECGYVEIPSGGDRASAIEAAVEWMQANPEGVDL